jgi:hypothetical protein
VPLVGIHPKRGRQQDRAQRLNRHRTGHLSVWNPTTAAIGMLVFGIKMIIPTQFLVVAVLSVMTIIDQSKRSDFASPLWRETSFAICDKQNSDPDSCVSFLFLLPSHVVFRIFQRGACTHEKSTIVLPTGMPVL